MRRTILIRLGMILMLVSISLAISSRTIAQSSTVDTAKTSPTSADDDLVKKLDKTLDAYEKALAVIAAKDNEIETRKQLDALKNELLAAKDQMIKDIMADNDFLRKQVHPSKSKLRAFFDRVEKLLILAAGVYVGRGL
jgi:cell shape-determining protein MreC